MDKSINFKSFLLGYAYAITSIFNHPFNKDSGLPYAIDSQAMDIKFSTKDGSFIHIAANRGISPLGGRVGWILSHYEDSLYDIYIGWVSEEVWKKTCVVCGTTQEEMEINTDMEARLTYKQLEKLVEACGGISLENQST